MVTDKTREFTPRFDAINRLAREIAEARQKRKISLVVGNGSGSFAHTPAKKYKTKQGLINKDGLHGFAVVQDAAARLNRIVVRALIKAGENAISINPSSAIIAEGGRIKEFYLKPLEAILKLGIIPVVYGDVVVDTKMGCSIQSTEMLLNYIALRLQDKGYKVHCLVHYGTTPGVLDENGNTIPKITPENFKKVKKVIGGSGGIDVTGGMLHKVEEAIALAEKDIPSYIMNGFEREFLKRVLLGEKAEGTLVAVGR